MFFKKKKLVNIHTYGDPLLKKKSEPIKEVNHEIITLGQSLIDAMFADDGVGLAAPQVGINLRIVALGVPSPKGSDGAPFHTSPGEMQLLPRMPLVLVNPEIVKYSDVTDVSEEGCLSVPGIYAEVERPVSVTLRAQILGGENILFDCGGFLARAIQHELDHLDGILFVDRLSDEERKKIEDKLDRLKKQGKRKGFIKKIST